MSYKLTQEPLLSSSTRNSYGTSPRVEHDEENQEPDEGKTWMGSSMRNKFKKLAFGDNRASVTSIESAAETNTKNAGKTGPARYLYYIVYALV